MKCTQALLLLPVILASCAAAPRKSTILAPPGKPAQLVFQPDTKTVPKLPVAYTQKGVAVKIDELWQAPDGQILGVTGSAKNVTASDLKFCQVSLLFLDTDGGTVDEAKASTKSLKSGQIWHFQAALRHPSQSAYGSVIQDKVVAVPIKRAQAALASLK